MNRLLFYLLLLSVVGCAQVQPDNPDKEQPGPVTDEYLLHDSYFYDDSNKVFLTPCEDEYIIAFNVADKAEVYEYIKTEGFVELQGHMTFGTAGEERAYPWNEYILAWLKGDGDVSSIPKVIYTGILYKYRTEPEKRFYASHRLCVKWSSEDMLKSALKYAEDLNLLVDGIDAVDYVYFICTDESAGNSIEMANWFCEVGGFPDSSPMAFETYNGYD